MRSLWEMVLYYARLGALLALPQSWSVRLRAAALILTLLAAVNLLIPFPSLP